MQCIWCKNELPPSSTGRPRKYCSAQCRQRAYESRKYGMAEVWKQLEKYSDCYLCGDPLDWDDRQSVCLDHMIATVHGGRTHPENLRPVHVICNLQKGAELIKPA